ncbi:sensor histidine kinase [Amycolatopsis suaedae]|uniref:histidine kinase n=1 Tax=Amycolatopsis suaedae TaxID=2510978 RepID=A0A4Q7J647_9PSEU|nr:histidine kinase [Amycolatopsis suaedae]RZQ63080.1 two-component sensor histidine kinase [Amycolatopsis suaedae]
MPKLDPAAPLSWFLRLPQLRQDIVIALGFFGAGAILYATDVYPVFNTDVAHPLWARFLVLGTLCLLTLLRRHTPVLSLLLSAIPVTVDAVLGTSAPVLIVASDFLYAATLYGSRRTSRVMIGVAAFGTIAAATAALIVAPDWRAAVLATFVSIPFIITPVWWATNVRQHRMIAEAERANAVQLARIAELDRRAAVAGERARMARDLHDVIAGHLSAIAIQSEAALSIAASAKPETVRAVLESVRSNSVDALAEMRAMIGLLRADDTTDEATAPARLTELSKLVESARASGMTVEVRADDAAELPAAVDLTAYRIAQEALTNAVKHAPGRSATVSIRRDEAVLTVEVTNELPAGRAAGSGLGHGLLNMRERAQAIGGTFTAGPADSVWRVLARLPMGEPAT